MPEHGEHGSRSDECWDPLYFTVREEDNDVPTIWLLLYVIRKNDNKVWAASILVFRNPV